MKNTILMDSEKNFLEKKFIKDDFIKWDIKEEKFESEDFSETIDLFKKLNYEIDILKYNEKTDDFIMIYTENLSNLIAFLLNENKPPAYINKYIINRELDKVFPTFKYSYYRDLINRTQNDENFNVFLNMYEDKKLIYRFNQKFTFYKNHILVLTKPVKDLELNNPTDYSLFESSHQGMGIIQDNKYVKVNQNFLNITNIPINEIIGQPFDIRQDNYESSDGLKISEIHEKLLNREIPYYEREVHDKIKDKYYKTYMICENYNEKPAIFLTLIDMTNFMQLEKRTNELMKETDKVAYVFWDNINNYNWTNQIYDILEIQPGSFKPQDNILPKYMDEEHRNELERVENEAYLNFSDFRLPTKINVTSGEKDIVVYGKFFTTNTEGIETYIGYVQDISDKVKRNELEEELDEKEILLKEVHHRIKNNLQIILSLLKLDTRYKHDAKDEIIDSTQARIRTMAIVHEQIYQSSDLAHVNIKEYLDNQINSLFNLYSPQNINRIVNVVNTEIGMDYATPLGLIINEMIVNTIKYAFPNGEGGNLEIDLEKLGNKIKLYVTDDGIGLPEDLDISTSPTLGLTIINSLVEQLEGTFKKLDCKGTGYIIEFEINPRTKDYKL